MVYFPQSLIELSHNAIINMRIHPKR